MPAVQCTHYSLVNSVVVRNLLYVEVSLPLI